MPKRPLVIGLAGTTTSGQSEIIKRFINEFPDNNIRSLSSFGFYYDKEDMPGTAINTVNSASYVDFNHPSSIDYKALATRIRDLKENLKIDVLFVDGNTLLYYNEVRSELDISIFIEIDRETRHNRRLSQANKKPDYSVEALMEEYNKIEKSEDKYVIPTKDHADFIINGYEFSENFFNIMKAYIEKYIKERHA